MAVFTLTARELPRERTCEWVLRDDTGHVVARQNLHIRATTADALDVMARRRQISRDWVSVRPVDGSGERWTVTFP